MAANHLRVALLQYSIVNAVPAANRRQILLLSDELDGSVDLMILPELFLSGFGCNPASLPANLGAQSLEVLRFLARRYGCYCCGSTVWAAGSDHFRNRMLVVGPEGEPVHYYDKRHLFGLGGEQDSFVPGGVHQQKIIEIGGFRALLQICYDLRFPVYARNTAHHPYDLIINVANWPARRAAHWRALLPARAIENQVYVVAVNCCGMDKHGTMYAGESQVLAPDGQVLVRAGRKQEVVRATLERSHILELRRHHPFLQDGDAFQLLDSSGNSRAEFGVFGSMSNEKKSEDKQQEIPNLKRDSTPQELNEMLGGAAAAAGLPENEENVDVELAHEIGPSHDPDGVAAMNIERRTASPITEYQKEEE